jgi:hypothetical protein
MINTAQLDGFVPIRVYWQQSTPWIDWCYLGEDRFTDSFFDNTIARRLQLPFNQLFRPQTPVEVLLERAALRPGIIPSGFIFHMSRCGSTLVSQMLAALPRNIVISEAGPIDAMIRAGFRMPGLDPQTLIAWIRAVVSALTRPNHAGQVRSYVKLDCINTLSLSLIRQAFPTTPWIFLFRDPVEVLVSQVRQRGGLLLPGALEPELIGPIAQAQNEMSLDEYGAALISRICLAAVDHCHLETSRLVDYQELPDAILSTIAAHFGEQLSEEDTRKMRTVSQLHAKNPRFKFSADSDAKQREASAELRRLAERWLAGPYALLVARHQSQPQLTGAQVSTK